MPQELLVLSPEKTVLSFNLARLPSRVSAQIVDLLLIIAVIYGAIMLFSVFAILNVELAGGALIFFITLFPFAYFILLEGLWNGQTLGKKAASIRVRMADGTPITFGAALARNFLRVADILPGTYFLGILAIFTNPKSQRLGDMAAGTIVTHERKPVPLFSPAPYVLGIHAFEEYVGDLHYMTPDDYNALKRYCDRFPELPTRVQDRLTRDVWDPFAERFKIRPLQDVHPLYLAEAVVMKYGRSHGLL